MRVNESLAVVASLQFRLAGPLDCHVYALRGPEGLVLIDSGAGTHSASILENLRADVGAGTVDAILLTHCHADHAAGAAGLRRATGCRVVAPEPSRRIIETRDEEGTGLRKAREAGVYPPDFRMEACPVGDVLRDAECVRAAGLEFQAIHVQGHSPDAFCLLVEVAGARWLFCGDVLFYGGVLGLINADGSDLAAYRRDLPKLSGLRVDGLFPGHGLFTLAGGQRHIDCALEQLGKGFVPRMVGQGDLIF